MIAYARLPAFAIPTFGVVAAEWASVRERAELLWQQIMRLTPSPDFFLLRDIVTVVEASICKSGRATPDSIQEIIAALPRTRCSKPC